VLVEVADFYQKAKRYEDAERTLRHAREVDPRSLRTLFQLGATSYGGPAIMGFMQAELQERRAS